MGNDLLLQMQNAAIDLTQQLAKAEARAEAAVKELARAEAAEAAIEKAKQSEYAATLDAENAKLALATARAVTMEEAARAIDAAGYIDVVTNGEDNQERPAGNILRALAPLPAGLVVVPVPVLEQVKDILMWIRERVDLSAPGWASTRTRLDAALEALTKEMKR